MLRFNQSKNKLKFSLSGRPFECEPWGSVDLTDEQFAACLRRGMPLGQAPAATEVRANVRIAQQKEEADQNVVISLRKEADEAKAQLDVATKRLDEVVGELDKAKAENRKLHEALEAADEKIAALKSEAKAAEEMLNDVARESAELEEQRIREEALKAEGGKTAEPTEATGGAPPPAAARVKKNQAK
jgi:predicted RNase H-like nuclease (RuvC/YqgF family)